MSSPPCLTIAQAVAHAQARGLDRLDAQLLTLHAAQRAQDERAWLIAHDTDVLLPAQQAVWEALIHARVAGQPLAYLVGEKAFFGLTLHVCPDVLVPRPDTETLVEWALDVLAAQGLVLNASAPITTPPLTAPFTSPLTSPVTSPLTPACAPHVLDLGTGSGAVALAIKAHAALAQVSAVDASAPALAQAAANGTRLGLDVRWQLSNWFEGVAEQSFDLVVSNPPYIELSDPHMAQLQFEPASALTSGVDGLDDIRTIIDLAPAHLRPQGWLLLEHGWKQADAVAQLLTLRGFKHVQTRRDLGGNQRCTGGQWVNATPIHKQATDME
ncbi:MAG: peptide chain release factor N(5)-glutamine methyltransferase [Burkholderiaceae bacterium]|nr:peptide chain release factor N(5)-glutamine methyltransferase [Burkholderiaceae bacterium]